MNGVSRSICPSPFFSVVYRTTFFLVSTYYIHHSLSVKSRSGRSSPPVASPTSFCLTSSNTWVLISLLNNCFFNTWVQYLSSPPAPLVSGSPKGNLEIKHWFSSQVSQIRYQWTHTTHGKAKVKVRWDSILSIHVLEVVDIVNWYGSCHFPVSTRYFVMIELFHG